MAPCSLHPIPEELVCTELGLVAELTWYGASSEPIHPATDRGDSSSVYGQLGQLRSSTLCGSPGKASQQRRLDTAAARRAQCSETPEVSRFLARMFTSVHCEDRRSNVAIHGRSRDHTLAERIAEPARGGKLPEAGRQQSEVSEKHTCFWESVPKADNWGQMSHVQVV